MGTSAPSLPPEAPSERGEWDGIARLLGELVAKLDDLTGVAETLGEEMHRLRDGLRRDLVAREG